MSAALRMQHTDAAAGARFSAAQVNCAAASARLAGLRCLTSANLNANHHMQLRKGRELVEESAQVQPVGRPHRLHEPLSQVNAVTLPYQPP